MVFIFFERTTLDECVSINIAEEYKVMFLGDHNLVIVELKVPFVWLAREFHLA